MPKSNTYDVEITVKMKVTGAGISFLGAVALASDSIQLVPKEDPEYDAAVSLMEIAHVSVDRS